MRRTPFLRCRNQFNGGPSRRESALEDGRNPSNEPDTDPNDALSSWFGIQKRARSFAGVCAVSERQMCGEVWIVGVEGHHSCNHIALHRTQHKHPVTTDCVRTTITNHTWDIFCWSSATFCQIEYTTMRFTTKKTTLADARNGIFRISRNLLEHTADESSFHTFSRVIQLFQIYYFTNRIRRRSRSQHIWQHDHANHHSHDH